MKRYLTITSVALFALAVVSATQGRAEPVKKDQGVSIQRQLRLMRKLQLGDDESLVASLRKNRQQWEKFTPGQRSLVRKKVWAFRKSTPAEQREILSQYGKFIKLSPMQKQRYRQRMDWVKRVLEGLSAKERADVLALPAAEQARTLLRLKKLLPTGENTATRPVDETPTPRPATE